MTRCANPACRKVLDPVRVAKTGARVCNDRCRAAAWKTRVAYGRHDVVSRANGSQARNKPSGAQVSYFKAREAIARRLGGPSWNENALSRNYWLCEASDALRPALSDRQRAQLDARERGSE
jgi:hypothetical protein